jgi:HlyD family secretion protein
LGINLKTSIRYAYIVAPVIATIIIHRGKMMKKKHIIFISIIVLIILAGVIAYVVKNNKSSAAKKAGDIVMYTIPDKEKIFVNGVIIPEKTDNIYLDPTKGIVNKVSIINGQEVKKGEVLFTYKNEMITDQIKEIEQQVTASSNIKNKLLEKEKQAKELLVKQKAEAKELLVKQKAEAKEQVVEVGGGNSYIGASLTASTEAEISSYKDQIESVQTQIDAYQNQLKTLKGKEFTNVTASMDGKVLLNDSLDPSKPYIVIETKSFYIKGSVNEKDQIKLKKDQLADILVFATNKTITGKLISVGDRPAVAEINAAGGNGNISFYDANISLDSQENIISGFHVQATLQIEEGNIKIPKTSILEEASKSYVFKAVDKKLIKQEIKYEKSDTDDVVVLSGLKESDSITINTKDMKEGLSVE